MQKRRTVAFWLRSPTPSAVALLLSEVVEVIQNPLREQKRTDTRLGVCSFLVAEVGFEPHDLRVMSPSSYQAALLRDIVPSPPVVPVTGIEPVRYFRITGF